jgi:PP-loop superfamily ATP-utilizing enzyme
MERSPDCEAVLEGLGFGRCRVSVEGAAARISVPPEEIPRLSEPGIEIAVHEAFRDRGFLYVSIDLSGTGIGGPDATGLVSGAPEDL